MLNMDNKLIPDNLFQTVVPSNDGTLTVRTLNTSSKSNSNLLQVYQIKSAIPPQPVNTGTCFEGSTPFAITSQSDLFNYLCEVLIRFDTNPNFYQKEDYKALLRLLTGSLNYIYTSIGKPINTLHITQSNYIATDAILAGELLKVLIIYNNEDIDLTVNLGYSEDGKELLEDEILPSKTWMTFPISKLLSIDSATSLYFNTEDTITSNGVYLIFDAQPYFTP